MPFPLSKPDKEFVEKHFPKKQFRWDEDFFLHVLQHPRSKRDVYWAAIGLREVGTESSIEPLRVLFTFPMQDVKCVAILTFAHIGRERVTPVLAQALLDPGYRDKFYAMWAINDAADQRAIPAVLEYFTKNKSKLKQGKLTNGTLVEGVEFLSRHMESDKDAKAFIDSISVFWKTLIVGERIELRKRLPELASKIEEASALG